jgi:hypothetical protein
VCDWFLDAYLRNIGSREHASEEELKWRQLLFDSPRSRTDEFVFMDNEEDEKEPPHGDDAVNEEVADALASGEDADEVAQDAFQAQVEN